MKLASLDVQFLHSCFLQTDTGFQKLAGLGHTFNAFRFNDDPRTRMRSCAHAPHPSKRRRDANLSTMRRPRRAARYGSLSTKRWCASTSPEPPPRNWTVPIIANPARCPCRSIHRSLISTSVISHSTFTRHPLSLCLATSVGLSLALIIVAGGGGLVRMPLPR